MRQKRKEIHGRIPAGYTARGIGRGQLGRMLIQGAIDLNVQIHILDPSASAPARPYAHAFTQGSLTDYDTVMAFGQGVDLLTVEIEHVNTDALAALKAQGKTVYPDPEHLRLIQNKRTQKSFYTQHNLPTAPYILVENKAEVIAAAGRLPAVINSVAPATMAVAYSLSVPMTTWPRPLTGRGCSEDLIPFEKEVAVIVARNPQGQTVTYPVVEMVFHPVHNLVEYLFSPAELSVLQAIRAKELAVSVVEKMDYVGLLAVKCFSPQKGTS